MFNKNGTKRAFLMSVLSLILCISMFIGTTFAWFTDEVVSSNNIIQSGNLDAEMKWSDDNTNWNDAAAGAIFNYQYWEPGYTEVKYVKIVNAGNLAFQFQLNIIPDQLPAVGEVNLADVIEVRLVPAADAAGKTREELLAVPAVGTLSDLIADRDGAAHGVLLPAEGVGSNDYNVAVDTPRGELAYCIVLHMQKSAGNEYQNLSVGDGFPVQLLATQYTWENDSFDHIYDDNAMFPPKANVKWTGATLIPYDGGKVAANTTLQFLPTQNYTEAQQSSYRYYHADFVVSADGDIPANAVTLVGFYTAYCGVNGDWIGMSSDQPIAAGTEIRLIDVLGDMLGGQIFVNYEEICKWSDDEGFKCGVIDQSKGALDGVTLTVELRLYETTKDPDATSGTANEETGKYVTIGTYKYTFGAETLVANDAQLAGAITAGATNITLAPGTYHMPHVAQGKTLTINGTHDSIIEVVPAGQGEANGQLDYSLDGSNVTFNGVTIKTNSQLYAGYARLSAVYNDCVIQNTYNLGNGTSEFNNCTFNITNEYLRVGGASVATFDGCTFNTDGRAILVFQDGTNVAQTVTVKNCTFNATAAAQTWNGIHVAAVSYDGSQGGTYTVNFEGNNVVDSDFNGLWQIKNGAANVTVNGLN